MSLRLITSTTVRRARGAWIAVWLAVLLNVLAPVIAYATAAAREATAATTLAAIAADPHAHHHHDGAPPADALTAPAATLAPHCQYCLDFAAAAPLPLAVAVVVSSLRPDHARPTRPLAVGHPSPLVRSAWARGPPAFSA
jgi:hypothetical protein